MAVKQSRQRQRSAKSLRKRYASEYATWTMMRQRCRNRRCGDYARYGGRGIRIARRWDSFEAFLEDLGPRPKGYSLVRKAAHADFSPSTCSWRPRAEGQRHRSKTRLTEKDVARIRAKHRAGALRADLARQYGVSLSHVCYIVEGKRWKPVAGKGAA